MTQLVSTPLAVNAPMREFLDWVGRRPRTYSETMDAWASHCPRYTLWEDALAAGLVELRPVRGASIADASVTLTPAGCAEITR